MPKRNLNRNRNRAVDERRAVVDDYKSRKREALRVLRAGNTSQDSAFHSIASTLIVSGANRSGKSLIGYALAASRMMGVPLFDNENKQIPLPFPVPDTDGAYRYWVIGYDLNHIGQTVYRCLFEPGLFNVIYNPSTKQYEAFNENNSDHVLRRKEKVPADPLIPSRMIVEDSWVWNAQGGGRAANCFESVRLKNGAKIYAFPSSTPQPKQGDPIDGLVIDEDVKFPQHVPEYVARLGDKRGWMLWLAWPHDDNYMLGNLIDGCERAMEDGDSRFEHVSLSTGDNAYFAPQTKKLIVDRMTMLGDAELMESRYEGKRDTLGRKMYEFRSMEHAISSTQIRNTVPDLDPTSQRGVLQKVYRKDGKFPDTWTRYLALDPSTTRTAVIFGVVPPPVVEGVDIRPTLIVERELVLKRASAKHVAMACREVTEGRQYEAFVIDKRMGQQTRVGSTEQVWDTYARAFEEQRLFSRTTKQWFIPGSDNILYRTKRVRGMLDGTDEDGFALYVLLDYTPEWQKEVAKYYKKKEVIVGVERVTDLPENPRKFDCMQGTEYLVAFVRELMVEGTHYVKPSEYSGDPSPLAAIAAKLRPEANDQFMHLGPTAGLQFDLTI